MKDVTGRPGRDGAPARIGVIGTDNSHAYAYSAFLNGWADSEPVPTRLPDGTSVPDMYLWAALHGRLRNAARSPVPAGDARVTAIWSDDRRDAERVARACGIDRVCASPREACEDVDAVMVLSKEPSTHLEYARLSLQQGLPTYVDKPLAESFEAGRSIFELAADHGAPCYTGSSLRWSPELLTVRDAVRRRPGPPRTVSIQCPLSIELYGIHGVEMANMFLGSAVDSVQSLTASGRQITVLEYPDGSSALIENLEYLAWPTYSVLVGGETWHEGTTFHDPSGTSYEFVRRFVQFVHDRVPPVSARESLSLIRIVDAILASHETGRRVSVTSADEGFDRRSGVMSSHG
ncbi:dehydrogenase [Amycolatopsis deserti]|uniref:Dehydrogenase n=1 Tax=Amycolatopsis deserti TaxID=185696 RepID=A0ABQ3J0L9_9PSEU|nr:Gfo/Idh/MocA family oxidoreductase [Amycolatopsis deserti]GHE98775.1 dehydrogenase [Amycolatopsis deserti]